jgi:hypothetical protein
LLVLTAHSQEGQVVLRVDVTHHRAGFLGQLDHLLGDLDRVVVLILGVHGGPEDFTILIDDQETDNASVVFNAENALFDFCHLNYYKQLNYETI